MRWVPMDSRGRAAMASLMLPVCGIELALTAAAASPMALQRPTAGGVIAMAQLGLLSVQIISIQTTVTGACANAIATVVAQVLQVPMSSGRRLLVIPTCRTCMASDSI